MKMAKKKAPPKVEKPTGRPEKEINWTTFETLCGLDCTQIEIAQALGIHDDTLRNRVEARYGRPYSTVYKGFRSVGDLSIRRALFEKGVKRQSTKELLYLANNRLGYSNRLTIDGQLQATGPTMDDVKKVITDPVAAKLAQELAQRMLELEEKQNEQTPEESTQG